MLRNANKKTPVLRAREALELFILMKNSNGLDKSKPLEFIGYSIWIAAHSATN